MANVEPNENPRQTKRIKFRNKLSDHTGVTKMYFQRPPKHITDFDRCIVYSGKPGLRYADNHAYIKGTYYTVTYIHSDPDDEVVDKLCDFPYSHFDRQFISDDLYHDVFIIFYI